MPHANPHSPNSNIRAYENLSRSYSQLYMRFTLDRMIIKHLAPMFSESGWKEILALAKAECDVYCGTVPKPLTAAQQLHIARPREERKAAGL